MTSRADALRRAVPRLASDTGWYSVAGVVGKGLALLSVPFLTRALGPSDYGLVDLATATAGVLTVVAMFSGDIPAARLVARADSADGRRKSYTEYVIAVASLSVAIAAVVMVSSGWIANTLWSSPGAEGLVLVSATLIPISGIRAALATLQRLEGNSRRFAALATVDVVAQLVLAVAFVAAGFGAFGAIVGFVAGATLALLVAVAFSRHLLGRGFEARAITDLISSGLPLLPAFIAFIAADYVARAIVAGGLGHAAVGEFGLALRIASVLALLTAAFQLAWSPRAAAMSFDEETLRTFGRTLVGYTMTAGLICVALISLSPEFIDLVSGDEFGAATKALPGLALAAVLAGTHFILSMGTVVAGGTWMVAVSSVIGAIVQIIVTATTIGSLGLWAVGLGAAMGRATSVVLLGIRVTGIFGRRMSTASLVLVAASISSLLIGLTSLEHAGSQTIRLLVAASAAVAMAVFVTRTRPRDS